MFWYQYGLYVFFTFYCKSTDAEYRQKKKNVPVNCSCCNRAARTRRPAQILLGYVTSVLSLLQHLWSVVGCCSTSNSEIPNGTIIADHILIYHFMWQAVFL